MLCSADSKAPIKCWSSRPTLHVQNVIATLYSKCTILTVELMSNKGTGVAIPHATGSSVNGSNADVIRCSLFQTADSIGVASDVIVIVLNPIISPILKKDSFKSKILYMQNIEQKLHQRTDEDFKMFSRYQSGAV